jgi:hypothetical protein
VRAQLLGDAQLVAGDCPAAGAGLEIVGPAGDEEMQCLGGADSVEDQPPGLLTSGWRAPWLCRY